MMSLCRIPTLAQRRQRCACRVPVCCPSQGGVGQECVVGACGQGRGRPPHLLPNASLPSEPSALAKPCPPASLHPAQPWAHGGCNHGIAVGRPSWPPLRIHHTPTVASADPGEGHQVPHLAPVHRHGGRRQQQQGAEQGAQAHCHQQCAWVAWAHDRPLPGETPGARRQAGSWRGWAKAA